MLLSELFESKPELLNEMPYLKNKEMPLGQSEWTTFFSQDTLARTYKLLHTFPEQNRVVYISNDHVMAFIGEPGVRKADAKVDDKPGVHVLISCEFKEQQHLTHDTSVPSPQLKGALQIDIVEVHNAKFVGGGDGTLLYAGLVAAGITIISDNTQYAGGAALWKKLAAKQQQYGYMINILVDGKPMVDAAGKLVVYNGHNVPDDQLWSERPPQKTRRADAPEPEPDNRPDRFTTLFIMRKA